LFAALVEQNRDLRFGLEQKTGDKGVFVANVKWPLAGFFAERPRVCGRFWTKELGEKTRAARVTLKNGDKPGVRRKKEGNRVSAGCYKKRD